MSLYNQNSGHLNKMLFYLQIYYKSIIYIKRFVACSDFSEEWCVHLEAKFECWNRSIGVYKLCVNSHYNLMVDVPIRHDRAFLTSSIQGPADIVRK